MAFCFCNLFSNMTRRKYLFLFRNTNLSQISFIKYSDFLITEDINKFGIKNLKGGHSRRPEIAGAIMYGEQDVLKYIKNERNAAIQSDMTKYALKLLKYSACNDKSEMFLDIGCGCGISSQIIESYGHFCVGVDISHNLLDHAWNAQSASDFIQLDVSKGLNFKQGTFRFAISISVLQWVVHEESLLKLFGSLENALEEEGKAVFQFYPRNTQDLYLILTYAEKFFDGCILTDYPSINRGMKIFLYLLKSGRRNLENYVHVVH